MLQGAGCWCKAPPDSLELHTHSMASHHHQGNASDQIESPVHMIAVRCADELRRQHCAVVMIFLLTCEMRPMRATKANEDLFLFPFLLVSLSDSTF